MNYFSELTGLNLTYISETEFNQYLKKVGIKDIEGWLKNIRKEDGTVNELVARPIFKKIASLLTDPFMFVTWLDRNLMQLELIKEKFLAEIISKKRDSKKIRIVVVGPASGEEMAAIFTELFKAFKEKESQWRCFSDWDIQIKGIELNQEIIKQAQDNFIQGFSGEREPYESKAYLEEVNKILKENRALVKRTLKIRQSNIVDDDVINELDEADIIFCNAVAEKLTSEGIAKLREKFASLEDAYIFVDTRFKAARYPLGESELSPDGGGVRGGE